jgi:hypothetical protein
LLARLSIAFFVLSSAIGIAACSSYANATVGGNGNGPNFPSQTLYATNSNQNAVSIYNHGQKSGTGPAFEIGGASTTIDGPQYLAFDRGGNLWVTNYSSSTNKALLIEIAALATGNVIPLLSTAIQGHPRGIAFTPKATPTASAAAVSPDATKKPSPSPSPSTGPTIRPELMVISSVIPTNVYPSQLLLFVEGSTAPYQSIAGPNPNLNVPGGVAIDNKDDIYVTNIQGGSVDKFTLPTPSPTPKPTPKPSSTPSPTPSPSVSPSTTPSASPTPSPTPTPINVRPIFTIPSTKTTHVITPTGVAVDVAGNIYVADQGSPSGRCTNTSTSAAVLEFAKPPKGGVIFPHPIRIIAGCNTKLRAPTDVKVDSSGLIYVADTNTIWIFSANANRNVAPLGWFTSPGAVTGLGVVP